MFKKINQIKITKRKKTAETYYKQYENLYANPKQNVNTIKKLLIIMKYLMDTKAHFQYLKVIRRNLNWKEMENESEPSNISDVNRFLLDLIPSNLPKIPLRTLNKIIHTEIRYTKQLEPACILPLIEERRFRTATHKDTWALFISIGAFLAALTAIFV